MIQSQLQTDSFVLYNWKGEEGCGASFGPAWPLNACALFPLPPISRPCFLCPLPRPRADILRRALSCSLLHAGATRAERGKAPGKRRTPHSELPDATFFKGRLAVLVADTLGRTELSPSESERFLSISRLKTSLRRRLFCGLVPHSAPY